MSEDARLLKKKVCVFCPSLEKLVEVEETCKGKKENCTYLVTDLESVNKVMCDF